MVVSIPICGRFGLWPTRFVAVSVCGRSGLGLSGLWPFPVVAITVCSRFGLWPFRFWSCRFVAVMIRNPLHCRDNGRDGVSNHQRLYFYWTVCSGVDQRKHQCSAPLAFVWGIRQWPVNSTQKGPVTREIFHLMTSSWNCVYYRVLKHETGNKLWSVFLADLHCHGADWWRKLSHIYLSFCL